MGEAARPHAISHAGSRPAAHPHAARSALKRFASNQGGATAIEYAIIAAGIAVAIIGALSVLSDNVKAMFSHVASSL
jgi:pilus assembly protein Flp/PilA